MASVAHGPGWQGSVEILDRESGDWRSLPDFRTVARQARAVLAEYSYGYQERFIAANSAERVILEPFYSAAFILGCAESCQTLRGADLFLTGGDEEELWLIESDGKEVAVDLVTDTAAQTTLMAAAGGAIDFQRVGRTVVEGLPTAVRSRLLRAGTASWELVVKAWMEQYLALLDILLEVKKDTGADRLMRHRERLVAAELKAPSSRARYL